MQIEKWNVLGENLRTISLSGESYLVEEAIRSYLAIYLENSDQLLVSVRKLNYPLNELAGQIVNIASLVEENQDGKFIEFRLNQMSNKDQVSEVCTELWFAYEETIFYFFQIDEGGSFNSINQLKGLTVEEFLKRNSAYSIYHSSMQDQIVWMAKSDGLKWIF